MQRTLRLSGKTQLTRASGPHATRVGRPCRDGCSVRCVCPAKRSSRVRRDPSAHAWLDLVATVAAYVAFVRQNAAHACVHAPPRTRGSTLSRRLQRTLHSSGKTQLTRASTPGSSAHVRLARRTARRNPGKSNLEKQPVPFSRATCPLFQGMFRAADRAVPRVRRARFAPPTLRFPSRTTFEPLVTLSAPVRSLSIMNPMQRPERR
jgi:hypothetical protein